MNDNEKDIAKLTTDEVEEFKINSIIIMIVHINMCFLSMDINT